MDLSSSDTFFLDKRKKSTLPIFVVSVDDFETWAESAPDELQGWLKATGFRAKGGACALLPSSDGISGAVITVDDPSCPWEFAGLTKILPPGSFEAEPELSEEVSNALCIGWALSSYHFTRYKSRGHHKKRQLVWPDSATPQLVRAIVDGIFIGRDLVNMPASHMGPEELAEAARVIAKQHGAKYSVIEGDALLSKGYPMVHAVGRASSRSPRLVDFSWGKSKHPKLTLVGKGVCFDTGGLDLKPPQFMKLMKKDMGGAAVILGLAHAIMAMELPVRLRVLIPAVENSVSGNAMRPLDVLPTRKGITVEVGDTDAEGRLILGDALFEAAQEDPDLIIDAATLTGAARVAVGTEMPAIFASSNATWNALELASESSYDPLWRLPLHSPYRRKLESKIADICNISGDSYGGAIVAALFLREFVSEERDWVHMDTMGYNIDSRPGRPAGGEALGLMALFAMIQARYGSGSNDSSSSDIAQPTAEEPPVDLEQAEQPPATDLPKKAAAKTAAKKSNAKKSGAKKSGSKSKRR